MASGQYKNKAYPLRINEATLDTVKSIAEANKISANRQIELILEDYVRVHSASAKSTKREVALNIAKLSKAPRSILTKIEKRP